MATHFEQELQHLLSQYAAENGSNTPDFILAEYLQNCLDNFNMTVNRRETWFGRGSIFLGEPVHISGEVNPEIYNTIE